MNIDTFLNAVLSQNAIELRKFFHEKALVRWHCTNEQFTVDEYIKANCEYPGDWDGKIERIEKTNNTIILVCLVFPKDKSVLFHVVSFISVENDLIMEMDEYWANDGLAPEWRKRMKIGKPIH